MEHVKIKDLATNDVFAFELSLHNRKSYLVTGVGTFHMHIVNRCDGDDNKWIERSDDFIYLLNRQ